MTCRSRSTNLIESVTAEHLPLAEWDIKADIVLALFLVYVIASSWCGICCTWVLLVPWGLFEICCG